MKPVGQNSSLTAQSSRPVNAPKLIELEGLREWLAWWVVVGHCVIEAGWSPAFLPTAGKLFLGQMLAVKLFIILSGFVITPLLDRQQRSYCDFIIISLGNKFTRR